ncbi:DinB family protein [Chitinophaga sp.]|uniref:DinB family protein n=1 Tax=Chitinophaga sp. TaxID=1869181 RepID=UPI0031DEECA5
MSRTFETPALTNTLLQQVDVLLNTAREQLLPAHDNILLRQPAPDKWSAAQCLDHLNAYARFYIPRIEKAIQGKLAGSLPPAPSPVFKSGWLGNYFTNMMLPKADGHPGMKMQAPKGYRPLADLNAKQVVNEFIDWQERAKQLLEQSKLVNLESIKIPTTLGNWLKFSLGDTFRFVIAHEQRHMAQALRAKYESSIT